MSVFTIYCHGTGGSAGQGIEKAEIINIFSNHSPGVSGSHDRILMPNDAFCNWKKTQVFNARNIVKSRPEHITLEGVAGNGMPHNRWFNYTTGQWQHDKQFLPKPKMILAAVGLGVDRNVENAVNYLEWMALNKMLPQKINMLGWSRGAIASIRIAYELSKIPHFSNIPVNIFAIDPVAGVGHNNEHRILGNVKNMVSIISTGENRRGFSPMITSTYLSLVHPYQTRYIELNFPGLHASAAKSTNAVGRICFNLAYRFLTHHGTKCGILDMFKMSNRACLDAYGLLLQHRGGTNGVHDKKDPYKNEKGVPTTHSFVNAMVTGLGRKERQIVTNTSSPFFYNSHHEAIFQLVYPKIYNSFIINQSNSGVLLRDVNTQDEWASLKLQVGEAVTKIILYEIENFYGPLFIEGESVVQEKSFMFDMNLFDDEVLRTRM